MDWIGLVLALIGILLNAKKNIWCWPIWIASDVFWFIYGFTPMQASLLVLEVVFVFCNIYGWFSWYKDSNQI